MTGFQAILFMGFCIFLALVVLIIVIARQGRRQGGTASTTRLGPYRDLTLLSDKGGMAKIYRAVNTERKRECVLKVLRTELLGDADAVKKFRQESEVLENIKKSSVNAPVVSVFTTGTISTAMVDLPFIEMEYVPGDVDLSDYLKKHGKMSPDLAEKVLVQILRALAAAQEVGVIHRDLKPGNILLHDGDPEKALVCDFGVAKHVDARSVTMGGYGTATYMSPEQCRTGAKFTPKADIYSLGVIFYELLTGRKLFDNENPFVVMKKHQEEDPSSLISEYVPERYRSLLSEMLSKEPGDRPDIERILAGLSGEALKTPGYKGVETEAIIRDYKSGARSEGMFSQKIVVGSLSTLLVILLAGIGYKYLDSRPFVPESTSEGHYPTKKSETVNQEAESVKPVGFGSLYVTSKPSGAEIFIDGKKAGNTPMSLKTIAAGKHHIIARLSYYKDCEKYVELEKDIVAKTHVELERGRGNITVFTTPEAAKIYLDGKKIKGMTPFTISGAAAGKHKIRFQKDTYSDKEISVEVKDSETSRVEATLTEIPTSRLYVKTIPEDAKVKILNIDPKFHQGIELEPGKYHVKVSAESFVTKDEWVSVVSGEEKRVTISLSMEQIKTEMPERSGKSSIVFLQNNIFIDQENQLKWYVDPHKKFCNFKMAEKMGRDLDLLESKWRIPTSEEILCLYEKIKNDKNILQHAVLNGKFWTTSVEGKYRIIIDINKNKLIKGYSFHQYNCIFVSKIKKGL